MLDNPLLDGLTATREPAPFTLFIFGASGDLTARKLLPALYTLFRDGAIRRFRVVGFARRPWSDGDFRDRVAQMLLEAFGGSLTAELKEEFLRKVFFISSTFESAEGYRRIAEVYRGAAGRIYYLATPPGAYEAIIERLGRAGLAQPPAGGGEPEGGVPGLQSASRFARVIVEKPFGGNLDSARRLNSRLAAVFREQQVYRIDHYLGKETVQNVMVLRFGNNVFEPIWNSSFIDHVQITMAENLGVGTRGGYYEEAGALRDIVQNHLMQLLCLVAMEPPNDLHADSIRDEKVKVLKALRLPRPEQVARVSVRGQYGAGIVEGTSVPGYRQEPGVDPASATETYVALRLELQSWRWAGVPFLLRTGKRLARRCTEIAVKFKFPPHILFHTLEPIPSLANTLVLRIQPDEGIMLNFNAKIPGYALEMRPVNMDFSYGSSFGDEPPEAYVRLLLDALLGDATLYTRVDEVEAAWRYVDSIRSGWRETAAPLASYPAGSSGPQEARALLEGGRRWRKL